MRPSPAVDERVHTARLLLDAFLEETGVVGPAEPRRYLWTDSFAVCTLLALHEAGETPAHETDDDYLEVARRLVDQVHHTLGRHRTDEHRRGWLSGLDEEAGAEHPTRGGLRIGKRLPERAPGEPENRRLEWERDGQYFHYLTRWMHALRQLSVVTGQARYLRWAVELARTAHDGFVDMAADPGPVLHWKMSIDLTRPLVRSAGRLDPLDGYLTYRSLEAPGAPVPADPRPGLHEEIASLAGVAALDRPARWVTDDPLSLGGLLVHALRVALLRARGVSEAEGLLPGLLDASGQGLDHLREARPLERPPARRLAFRELGLSLGVHAVERLAVLVDEGALPGAAAPVEKRLDRLLQAREMARRIEATWADPANRELEAWIQHRDINAVMLASSLVPDGYLRL